MPWRLQRLIAACGVRQQRLSAWLRLKIVVALARWLRAPLLRSEDLPGTAVVRDVWKHFLDQHRKRIHGRGVELGGSVTIRAYAGPKGLDSVDWLDVVDDDQTTIVADLCNAWNVPEDSFDVFLNPFTLHVLPDERAAFYHSLRILKPGGTLLCNLTALGPSHPEGIPAGDRRIYVERWYCPRGIARLLADLGVGEDCYELVTYGGLELYLAAIFRVPAELLPQRARYATDARYPVSNCLMVRKPANWCPTWRPADAPAREVTRTVPC